MIKQSLFTCVYCETTFCISELAHEAFEPFKCKACGGDYDVCVRIEPLSGACDIFCLAVPHYAIVSQSGQLVREWTSDDCNAISRRLNRERRSTNPEPQREGGRRYRARKYHADGADTPFDAHAQFKRQKGRCYYCKSKLTSYDVEHIVPLSRGGSDRPDNKVLSCHTCNVRKHNKMPHEWAYGGRLL